LHAKHVSVVFAVERWLDICLSDVDIVSKWLNLP